MPGNQFGFDGLGQINPVALTAAINEARRTSVSGRVEMQTEGTVVRFQPIRGITPASVLRSPLYLPAVLGDLQVDEDALHTEYDTLSGGQFSMPAMGSSSARRLRSGQLDTLVMDFDPKWIVATGQDPEWIRGRLSEILRARKPVHMLVNFHPARYRTAEFDGDITVRNLSRIVRHAEHDTRYFTLTYKEWRDASVSRRSHAPTALPSTHKLTAKDTLYSLSYAYYGTHADWRAIRAANGIPKRFGAKTPIVSLRGHFKVGAKIKIPKKPVANR